MRPIPVAIALLAKQIREPRVSQRTLHLSSKYSTRLPRNGAAVRHHRRLSTTPNSSSSAPSPPSPSPPPPSPPGAPRGSKVVVEQLTDREMLRRLLRRPQSLYWWVGGVFLTGVTLVAFGPELKLGVSKHTADVATKSLQDETLQSHTRELASQIVQTVLNDPKVLDQASQFIQRLVVMDSTRDAIRSLVVHTLNDKTTLQQVTRLAKSLVTILLEDPKTRDQVVQFLKQALQDPVTRQAVLKLLDDLMRDEAVRKNLGQLLAQTFATEPVKTSVSTTIGESVHDVLSRPDIQNHAKQFVGHVVQDQTVQAQSGDAIWGTVMYAITPGWLSWIWEKGSDGDDDVDEQQVLAVVAAAAAAGEATGTVTADTTTATATATATATGRGPEADAMLAETTESFVQPFEKRVELSNHNAAEEELEKEDKREGNEEEPKEIKVRSSRPFELLRRLTLRVPYASTSSSEPSEEEGKTINGTEPSPTESALSPPEEPPTSQEEQDQAKAKAKEFAEAYADRHWSGSGSGFL